MTEQVFSYTLDNGVRVFVRPHRGAELAAVVAGVATGSIHEGAMLGCGVSHYLEHLLFQGAAGFPGDAATRRIQALGGDFNAYTSYTHTAYYTELPAAHTAGAIEVLAAMVRAPELPEDKFLSEREVILRERDMRRDRPECRLVEALWESIYLRHPVRYPIIGYREQIAGVTREMLRQYHRERYTPGRVFFVVSGRVEPEAVRDAVAARLGDWPRHALEELSPVSEPRQLARRELEIVFPDPLARLAVGFALPPASDPVIPAAELLAGLIGQNASSVLIRELWQQRELATDLSAFAYALGCPGLLAVTATAVPEKLDELEGAIFAELAALRRRGFDAAELREEKLRRITDDRRELRSGRDWAFQLAEGIAATGSVLLPEAYQRKLEAVEPDDLMRLLDGMLDPAAANVVRQRPEGYAVPPRATAAAVPEAQIVCESQWSRALVLECREESSGLIDLLALLPGGTFWETAENNGISGVLAAVWGTGAGARDETEFAAWLDRHAIELSVTAGVNSLVVRLNAPREAERELWEAFEQLLSAPRLEARPLRRECANFLEGLRSRAASAAAAADLGRRMLFGAHPFGLGRGIPAVVKGLKPAAVREFYRGLWRAGQVVFGVAGAYDPELARQGFARLDAVLPWGVAAWPLPPEPVFPAEALSGEVALAREQCRVLHLIPGMREGGADRLALELLLQAENGLGAHLFRVIREERSLAYSTGVEAYCGRQKGFVALTAGCEYERADEVARLLEAEVRHWVEHGLSEEEFQAARLAVEVRFARRREDVGEYLLNAMFSEYFGNGYAEMERQAAALAHLTRAEVNAALQRCCAQAVGVTVRTVAATKKRRAKCCKKVEGRV